MGPAKQPFFSTQDLAEAGRNQRKTLSRSHGCTLAICHNLPLNSPTDGGNNFNPCSANQRKNQSTVPNNYFLVSSSGFCLGISLSHWSNFVLNMHSFRMFSKAKVASNWPAFVQAVRGQSLSPARRLVCQAVFRKGRFHKSEVRCRKLFCASCF